MRFACEAGSRVNFTFDTITPVRELVIVIPDLYLPRELRRAPRDGITFEHLPGIECVARFGARSKLAAGWRGWLLAYIDRTDLAGVAPACIAAAALDPALIAGLPEPLMPSVTRWIATPVHLHAGLTRVHFDQRGLLRLTAAEQAILAADFAGTFGASHQTLSPLPSGEFLLSTPGVPPLATEEPGRAACGELDQLMPSGTAAAPLRRLLAEIEMWLHALPLNEARRSRGQLPITALWPWGAAGRIVRPEQRTLSEMPAGFGRDAWLAGSTALDPNWAESLTRAAAACAVLSKGLIGVVIPGLALAVYVAVERDLTALRRLHWVPGLALFAAIAVPWFVLVQLRNPEFFRFFFIYEHFERYLLPEHHRPGPWWYFVPVALVGLWPWTPALPAAIARAWKAPAVAGFKLDRFLAIWAGVVFAFFSVSQSKLPGYILPAVPAILLLFSRHYPRLSERLRRLPALACAASGLLVALLAAALLVLEHRLPWKGVEVGYSIWLLVAAFALSAAGFAALELFRRAMPERALAAAALGSVVAIQLALSGTHVVDEHYSSERLIEQIAGEKLRFASEAPFYSVGGYDQSVPFYLGRAVTLVAHKDELAPGIAAEPQKYVDTVDEFVRLWYLDRDAYAIMKPPLYQKLAREGLPGYILVRDARWVVVARR